MPHFHAGDLVLGCITPDSALSGGPFTNQIVHCGPDGTIIDAHPLPGPPAPFRHDVQSQNMEPYRFDDRNGRLYIGTGDNVVLRFDDGWNGGEFYREPGYPAPDATHMWGMNFNHETGQLYVVRDVRAIGAGKDLAVISSEGVLEHSFGASTLNVQDEGDIVFNPANNPHLYYTNGNNQVVYHFDAFVGADPGGETTFYLEPGSATALGITLDEALQRLYVAFIKFGPTTRLIRVLDIATATVVNTYTITSTLQNCPSLDLSPDGSKLYGSGNDNTASESTFLIVDVATGATTTIDISGIGKRIIFLHVLGTDLSAGIGRRRGYVTWLQ